GLLLRAAEDHQIDPGRSWFVGDILDDVEAGRRAGCRTVLIDNGNETEWILNADRQPHYYAADIDEAARLILSTRDAELASRRACPGGLQDGGDQPRRSQGVCE